VVSADSVFKNKTRTKIGGLSGISKFGVLNENKNPKSVVSAVSANSVFKNKNKKPSAVSVGSADSVFHN
jgi:hypothetical protein